jgi:hypothetical protein
MLPTKLGKEFSVEDLIQKYSGKKIILLEDEAQVNHCLGWLDKINGEKLIIALSPFAMYELDRHKVPYEIIEDFYDPEELYDLGIDNYPKVEKLSNFIDLYIQREFSNLKEINIKPAFFCFLNLKILYDSTTIRIFQLLKLIEVKKPDTIIAYQTKIFPLRPENVTHYLFPNNKESIYSQLLQLPGWKSKILILDAAYAHEKSETIKNSINIKKRIISRVLEHIARSPTLYDFSSVFKKRGFKGLLSLMKESLKPSRNNAVFLYGGGYNWDYCRDYLKNSGLTPVIRISLTHPRWLELILPEEKESLANVWNRINKNKDFRDFFVYDGIDFFPILDRRLRFIVERITPSCLRVYDDVEIIIKEKRIKAIIASTFNRYVGHTVAQVAHNHGIPVITWQHGSNGYFNYPMAFYNDLLNSDFHFVFGEGVVRKYISCFKSCDAKIISIGSAALDFLQRGNGSLKIKNKHMGKNILYVTSTYYRNNLYISFPPPYSDNQLWYVQKGIVSVIGAQREYDVIIKLHPSLKYREPPLRAYVKEKGFSNCRFIRNERSFRDLLTLADIIVMDTGSTTLLQALTTNKTIFLYTGHLHIDQVALELLNKRAYCFDNIKTFISKLNNFLSGKDIGKVDHNNTEFLEYYGVYKLDHKAGMRAVKAVKSIIEKWEK